MVIRCTKEVLLELIQQQLKEYKAEHGNKEMDGNSRQENNSSDVS